MSLASRPSPPAERRIDRTDRSGRTGRGDRTRRATAVLAAGAATLALALTAPAGAAGAATRPVPPPPAGGVHPRSAGAPGTCGTKQCSVYADQFAIDAATGVSVRIQQTAPELSRVAGAAAQERLLAATEDQQQGVEAGLVESRELYGDARPRLYVAATVNGTAAYNTGFVRTGGTRVGSVLKAGQVRTFALTHASGRWYVSYAGTRIGYFPDSLWKGAFTSLAYVETGGYVADPTTDAPCTDMGTGRYGDQAGAASIRGYRLTGTSTATAFEYGEAPRSDYYRFGDTFEPTSLSFGGPGSGRCA